MSIKTPECNSLAEIITYPWSLAVEHCEKASMQTDYQWVHYTLATLEYIPALGTLVALIELIVTSILSCYLGDSATPAPIPIQPKRTWKFVPLPATVTAAPVVIELPKAEPTEVKQESTTLVPDLLDLLAEESDSDEDEAPVVKATVPGQQAPSQPARLRYEKKKRGQARAGNAVNYAATRAAFEAVFANKFHARHTLLSLNLLPHSLVSIIDGYVSSVPSRPRPEPKMIEDLQVLCQILYDTTAAGFIAFDISIQIREEVVRKNIPGPTPNLVYALDLSGSMAGTGIRTLTQSIPPSIRAFPDDGRQGVYTFASDHKEDFPLALREAKEKEEMATAIETGNVLRTRGGTQLKPSTQAAISALAEASIQDRIDNVEAPSFFVPCTDGANASSWSEGEVSEMFEVVEKYAPEIGDNIRIFPVGMGNGIKYDELRTLATSRGEVSTVEMGKPEQLRAVIDKILLQRGILLNQGFITIEAPKGCTITSIEGYQIKEGESLRLPIVSMLDGDTVRLTGRMRGAVDTTQSLKVSFEGFDQIARKDLKKSFEQPLAQGNNPHVAALQGQTDYYRQTLEALLKCDKEAGRKLILETISRIHLYHSDWITKLMNISSDLGQGENPAETIKDALERLPHSGKTKRSRHCGATIDTALELQRRGMFRLVTRDEVAGLFKADKSLQFFFRFTSSSDRHLVLSWPNPAKEEEPYEQLLKVEAPIDGSAPRFIHDNEKMQIKTELSFASLDLLLSGLDKYMADSVKGI